MKNKNKKTNRTIKNREIHRYVFSTRTFGDKGDYAGKKKKQWEVEVADDCCATTNNFDIIQKKRSERERLMSHFLPFLVFFFPGKVRPLQRQDPDDRHG